MLTNPRGKPWPQKTLKNKDFLHIQKTKNKYNEKNLSIYCSHAFYGDAL